MRHPIFSYWHRNPGSQGTSAGVPGGGGESLASYLASLGVWTLDLKFNEASGNIVNYGSDGGVGIASNLTYAQQGQLGAGESVLFNGTTSLVQFANAGVPNTKALTSMRWCFLINPSSLGEVNLGTLFSWNGTDGIRFQVSNVLVGQVVTTATAAQIVTDINQVDFLNTWTLLFVDYDDANLMGLGRRMRFIRATAASTSTLLTLGGSNVAATDTVVPQAGVLNIGNNTATTRTFAGLYDMLLHGSGVWSPAGFPTDLTIPNRIRSLVFNVPF